MRSSSVAAILLAGVTWATAAGAQQKAQGFGVERFYPSAPGAGWFVMDSLDMHGNLGGVMALTLGYAHDPWRVRSADGTRRLAVVSDEAFADFGFAVTYDRFRLYLNMDMPLAIEGQSGTVGGVSYLAPTVDPGSSPDTLSDVRVGFDARILGDERSPFRLGAGAQLFVPNGNTCWKDTTNTDRCDYDTDGTYRAMGRVLLQASSAPSRTRGRSGFTSARATTRPFRGLRGASFSSARQAVRASPCSATAGRRSCSVRRCMARVRCARSSARRARRSKDCSLCASKGRPTMVPSCASSSALAWASISTSALPSGAPSSASKCSTAFAPADAQRSRRSRSGGRMIGRVDVGAAPPGPGWTPALTV